MPPQNDSSTENEEISLLDIISVLIRHKKLILRCTIGAIVVALVYSVVSMLLPSDKSYLPNYYKPRATMLINKPDSGGLSSMLASSGLSSLSSLAGISAGGPSYGQLAIVIAKSNTILDALVDKFSLVSRYKIKKSPKTESRKALLKHYSALYDDKTGIVYISFDDRDPVLARDLVNYSVQLIDERFAAIGGNRNITKKEQLETKLADVKTQMTQAENEIKDFQSKHGVVTIESVASEQISTEAQVRSELIMKEMEIKTYGDVSKVQDPAYMRLVAERDNLSKLLDALDEGFSQSSSALPTQRQLPALALQFSHLQRDLAIQEKVFELLTQQYELIKLEISGTDPIIQVLEPAEAPDMKDGPSRAKICIFATLVAFFISVLAAFLIEVVKKIWADPEAKAKLRGNL